jgi:lactate permease
MARYFIIAAADWTWTQDYNPTGSAILSTLLAAAPIVVLLGLMGLARWSAPKAAGTGLLAALVVAVVVCRMPWMGAVAAAGAGACFGLFPIGWIVLAAVFLYALTVDSGKFEIVKRSVAALSPDRRIQALLIAFSFGAFVEGAAGFGTPVAISSALLIGAGFPPLYAAGLALLANTAPVAFGALGTPIATLAKVTGLDESLLSAMAGRQLPLFSLIVPAWMVCAMSGWRGLRGVWPAVLVCGGSFATVQFLVSNFLGPTLVDVAGGLISLAMLAGMLRVWQPREVWRFAEEGARDDVQLERSRYARGELASAWMPWIILSVCVFLWGLPQVRAWLDGPGTVWSVEIPELHARIYRDVSIVRGSERPEEAVFRLNWLSATGTGILVAAILSALWLRLSPYRVARCFWRTLVGLRWALATIAAMLAIAFVTRYSGTDVILGLAFTRTGVLYPFFAPLLGWLGVALTGSDTSSNALFGSLQRFTAERLGLNPVLICTANSTGGVMGKMIDAQSIVVSAAATNQYGGEGRILRFVFWHSVALAALMGLLTLAQAYVLRGMVPGG